MVKSQNFGTTIFGNLAQYFFFFFLKNGNFYCSQVQSSQKIRILAKNLNMAKIVTFT